jgi:hypothetical protein
MGSLFLDSVVRFAARLVTAGRPDCNEESEQGRTAVEEPESIKLPSAIREIIEDSKTGRSSLAWFQCQSPKNAPSRLNEFEGLKSEYFAAASKYKGHALVDEMLSSRFAALPEAKDFAVTVLLRREEYTPQMQYQAFEFLHFRWTGSLETFEKDGVHDYLEVRLRELERRIDTAGSDDEKTAIAERIFLDGDFTTHEGARGLAVAILTPFKGQLEYPPAVCNAAHRFLEHGWKGHELSALDRAVVRSYEHSL